MTKKKMEVFLPKENEAEAEAVASELEGMDTKAQRELLEIMKIFNVAYDCGYDRGRKDEAARSA